MEDTQGSAGRNDQIKVFARIRPPRKRILDPQFNVDRDEGQLQFRMPRGMSQGYVNNLKEEYQFAFNGIFDERATNQDVFDQAAREVIMSVLDGYNGTIFAYGQTGSGKTFTITGGSERYEDRGLIPRTINLVFQEVQKRSGMQYSVRVSYLEIYNNSGYDLLDPEHETKNLEDLPRVSLHSDDDGNIHLKNLGMLPVNTEEDALNLLFVGDTNRIISETPSNDASSRSHCIFTLNVEAQEVGGSTVRRSKLHLVDLAGSERIKKTNINGKILNEANYINLSLHYLEQVIVALHEKAQGTRDHIPYRNSMMTSVLRDSLGGNCKTVMIATLSVENASIDESISTCRFAERVAMIKNDAHVNESEDPMLVIRRLKQEIRDLKEQLQILKGQQPRAESLTPDERERCRYLVRQYLTGGEDAVLDVTHPGKVQECFSVLRELALNNGNNGAALAASDATNAEVTAYQNEITKLRLMVQARDNEISVLVGMLKQKSAERDAVVNGEPAQAASSEEASTKSKTPAGETVPEDPKKLMDRAAAFEHFRKSYRQNQVLEEQKTSLRTRYAEAKELGEAVNAARGKINDLKAAVERRRLERGMQGLVDNNPDAIDAQDSQEVALRDQMEAEKRRYKDNFLRLKELKGEIEHLQQLIETSRRKLQQKFEEWWDETRRGIVMNNRTDEEFSLAPVQSKTITRSDVVSKPATPASTSSRSAVPVKTAGGEKTQSQPPPQQTQQQPQQSRQEGATTIARSEFIKTGNAQTDADIAAFYRIRDQLAATRNQK